jgi:ribosomal protein L11 methyltransferase
VAFPDARVDEVEDGWEDRWREFHRPVRVGPLWIGPPWETPDVDATSVVIDPGRAFGTGAHPTTQLCLELLLEQPPGSVLDVGCGSGVLSIAAALLGHAPVVAFDVDPNAAEATRANAAANRVSVEFVDAPVRADLALANIALDVVDEIAPRLDTARLISSGYLVTDEPSLAGYRRVERRERDGWAADLHERR